LSLIKKLASQTAIYGVSSIVGRFLFFLLVPLHVRIFTPSEYGAVTYFYSFVSFIAILLTYGMETAYFRFATKNENNPTIFSTSILTLTFTSALFLILVWLNAQNIAELLKYPQYTQYVKWFAAIMAAEAVTAIPFAQLRLENKAWKFALLKLINIIINVALNLVFLIAFPKMGYYKEEIGIGYIFLANLISTLSTLVLLSPGLLKYNYKFDKGLLKSMLKFSVPLMIAGLAGMINETFDRIALRYLLPPTPLSEYQMGIYGGCYKLAMLMTIFIQAYRFAAEPFFFGRQKEKDNLQLYSKSMNYFVAICCLTFIGINLFMDWVKLFLDERYWEGLFLVPILLLANLFLGMYINFSMWFKLASKTNYGIMFSFLGAAITIFGLITLVPSIGYGGAAWTTLICYFLMAFSCLWVGQKNFPIPYNIKRIVFYILISLFIFGLNQLFFYSLTPFNFIFKLLVISGFAGWVFISERPKKVVA
jgi:O-antigen/teichoic acid export membrane protein